MISVKHAGKGLQKQFPSSTCHTSTGDLVLIPGVMFKTVCGGVLVPAALGWQGLAVSWSPSQHS